MFDILTFQPSIILQKRINTMEKWKTREKIKKKQKRKTQSIEGKEKTKITCHHQGKSGPMIDFTSVSVTN